MGFSEDRGVSRSALSGNSAVFFFSIFMKDVWSSDAVIEGTTVLRLADLTEDDVGHPFIFFCSLSFRGSDDDVAYPVAVHVETARHSITRPIYERATVTVMERGCWRGENIELWLSETTNKRYDMPVLVSQRLTYHRRQSIFGELPKR